MRVNTNLLSGKKAKIDAKSNGEIHRAIIKLLKDYVEKQTNIFDDDKYIAGLLTGEFREDVDIVCEDGPCLS
eukprot:6462741-Amphidinium_carterae.3